MQTRKKVNRIGLEKDVLQIKEALEIRPETASVRDVIQQIGTLPAT
jgi:hypothetical protein